MSFDGDEKLFEAHNTQLDLPIHSGLLPSSRTGPPLVLPFVISQTDPPSIASGDFETKPIALVVPFQLHDLNVHTLEMDMVPGEETM